MKLIDSLKRWYYHPGYMCNARSGLVRQSYATAIRVVRCRTWLRRRRTLRALERESVVHIPPEVGFQVLGPGVFPEVEGICDLARAIVREAAAKGGAVAPAGKKSYLRTYPFGPASVSLDSPVLRFALRPEVLAGVARYLGIMPVLAYAAVWSSRSVPDEFTGSQLYHCDNDDVRQVKVFVHVSDVEADHGPLTVVSAGATRKAQKHVRYSWVNSRYRVHDHEISDVLPEGEPHPLLGPAGTVAFVDTSRCFHYGSRVKGEAATRTLVAFQYVTPFAFILPTDYRMAAPFAKLATPDLPEHARQVLGAV